MNVWCSWLYVAKFQPTLSYRGPCQLAEFVLFIYNLSGSIGLKTFNRRTWVPLKILLVNTKKATETIKVMKVRGFDSRAVTYVILAGMFGTR